MSVDFHAPAWLVERVLELHRTIRRSTRAQLLASRRSELAHVRSQGLDDDEYAIDPPSGLIEAAFIDAPEPVIVTAEGLGTVTFPDGASQDVAHYWLLIDPLDGTREIMVDKRSAWVLTGIAPNRGSATTLADIAVGFATEVPPTRQAVGVMVRATRGLGAFEQTWDLSTDLPCAPEQPLKTSQAESLRDGFAPIVRYFPGFHGPLGRLADRFFERVVGRTERGKARVFDDAYITTGGQLYLLACGTYVMVADLRPEADAMLAREGRALGLCAHPYDLAGISLIAEEAGAVVRDAAGQPLRYPFDTTTNCAYVACANQDIWHQVQDALRAELELLRADGC